MLIEAYNIGLAGLSPNQIKQATVVAVQQFKFMPKPVELIELARTGGVSYEAQAALAWEELLHALSEDKPSLMSPIVAAIARQLGGFQMLGEMPLSEFATWKRKDFLSAHVVLSKENPERLAALTGGHSKIVKALVGEMKILPTREEIQQIVTENRRKLLEVSNAREDG